MELNHLQKENLRELYDTFFDVDNETEILTAISELRFLEIISSKEYLKLNELFDEIQYRIFLKLRKEDLNTLKKLNNDRVKK